MLYDFNNKRDGVSDFHQRVADRNIQSIDDRQEEIRQAKNGFIGMLAGILVGGFVGWIFLSPANNDTQKQIPIIRRQVTPFKVQPNDPGGMEIDNQDREIYHIVDNLPKEEKEVKIRPIPDQPKLVVESSVNQIDDIGSLVESIDEELEKDSSKASISTDDNTIKVAKNDLVGVSTNSGDKIVIPQKIEQIDIKLQDNINKEASNTSKAKEVTPKKEAKAPVTQKSIKGTWYTQIIASSSRSAVERLWLNLSRKYSFLNSYPHEVEEITSATGNTLYRLKVGRFEKRKQAEELFAKLKQNNISCIIKQN